MPTGAQLVIGDVQLLTTEAENILTATCASGPSFGVVAWHTGPTHSDKEGVFICKFLGAPCNSQRVSEGADPDCSAFDEGGYVSWITKDAETGLWTIYLSTFDRELVIGPAITSIASVANLVTRPYLAQFKDEPCLIYLNTDDTSHAEIHAYFIRSRRIVNHLLEIESPNDMIVKSSANDLAIAVEGKDGLFLCKFNGRTWDSVAEIPKEGSRWPFRFDFALKDNIAMFVMEFEEHQRIGSLAVNLSNGKFDWKWSITDYGKFPSIAATPAGWLISWVGAPALQLELQGKDYDPDHNLAYVDALNEIQLEVDSNPTDKDLDRRTDMEKIFGISYVPPWAPLWLGELDDSGRCINKSGPLGGNSDENFGTQLSFHGDCGILIWRSYDEHAREEDCVLKAREIKYAENKLAT
jgi:hypothetical protein